MESKCKFLHLHGLCLSGIKCKTKHCNLDHDTSLIVYEGKESFPEVYFDQVFKCEGRVDMRHPDVECGFSMEEVEEFIYSDAFKLACRDFVEQNLWTFETFMTKSHM